MTLAPIDRYLRTIRNKNKGFALVLVLWILSLLTVMAGSFTLTMRRETSIISGIKDNAVAAAAAEAGISVAEIMLLHPDQNKRWRSDGNLYQIDFGGTRVRLRLISESGKFDLNKATLQVLQNLMANAPIDDEKLQAKLVGAILDWRDADDLINLEGAEKDEYRKEGLKYKPRNKPFQTVEELQMVLGVNEEVYNWLEPKVTVWSGQNQINLKLAAKDILRLMPGLDADMIETYVATRLDNDKNDLPIPEFPANLLAGGGAGIGNNENITIVSEALMPDETRALITATVVKSGANPSQQFQLLKWQRNPGNVESLFTDAMDELLAKQYAEPELND
jgi:general secretion pathway protein K